MLVRYVETFRRNISVTNVYVPSYVQFASNFECFQKVNFGICYLASWSLNQFISATVQCKARCYRDPGVCVCVCVCQNASLKLKEVQAHDWPAIALLLILLDTALCCVGCQA